jgi:chemotaxis protein methyltransferase CheR
VGGRGGRRVVTAGAELHRFRELLAERLGWVFADNDLGQLNRVLQQRSAELGLSPAGYLRGLGGPPGDRHTPRFRAADPAEVDRLAEALSITETYFFRHGEQFRALTEEVLPERIRARSQQRALRLLSVGCSSGEEAYSLAIAATEARPDAGWLVSVLGLDANPAVLRRAVRGRYSAWSLRETPDVRRERWFRPAGGEYELDARIRDTVSFRQYNVADDDPVLWSPGRYDVIFCRNLLMYLTGATASALVARMTGALAVGGALFLGHTDTLGSRPDGLALRQTAHSFYYVKPDPSDGPVAAVPARPRRRVPPPPVTGPDRYQRAFALLREERFGEALALIEADPGPHPRASDVLLHGVLLTLVGRLEDAEILCRRLLDTDGLYADAHHLLAVCLEGGASVDVAIGHYRLAAYLDPAFAMPRLRLGLLARRRGDDRTATAELDQALHLLRDEREEHIVLFGGGFGRIALATLCRAELDAIGVRR